MDYQIAAIQQEQALRQLLALGLAQRLPQVKEVHRQHRTERRVIQRQNEIINEEINTTVEIYYF